MPDLLLELFSEEIPARMQRRAADSLKSLVTNALVDAGLTYEGARAFVTPRRLALHVAGLPAASKATREERKGPRVGAPEKALEGFLRGAGLASIDEAEIASDPKKGDFYVAVIEKPGRSTPEIVAEAMPGIIRNFPWPKSMRWGAGSLRWVRPLHSIVATFGPETEEPEVIPFEVDGIASSNMTRGHRFLAPDAFEVRRLEDYAEKLEKAKVVLDADRRKDIIAMTRATARWHSGWNCFDETFLKLPDEVIRLTIRANQKCFVLKDPATGALSNRFVAVSNIEAADGGATIIAGNEKVIRARLSDAWFFWETDLKASLESRLPKLDNVVFHEKLGTQGARIARLEALAREIAPQVGADVEKAARAARLAKADLPTQMVYEFPELQGQIGRTYAELQGEDASVATAIEDHYKPQGPSDAVPTDPVAIAVALADKLDLLTGFWAIDEKPTGSKDPYALRRAALGVIRIVLENGLRFGLTAFVRLAEARILREISTDHALEQAVDTAMATQGLDLDPEVDDRIADEIHRKNLPDQAKSQALVVDLLAFFGDRLKVHLKDEGARHDLIDAVFALEGQDDLLMRAANILRAEEKKDGSAIEGRPHADHLVEQAEIDLAAAIDTARSALRDALKNEDFAAAMTALAGLRAPVDRFFDDIHVNADDPELRLNRLRLLAEIREATLEVADFSKIAG
eukprot:jgi/Tetstr1/443190/TSEL_031230.t1